MPMTFKGALIEEQGVTFGIVVVKPYLLSNQTEANKMIAAFEQKVFPGSPVVLMAQDVRGAPAYYGRKDIVNFLVGVPLESIPWKKYTLN